MRNWPVIALREVADISAGITLGRKTRETDLIEVPYLRVANVQDGQLVLTDIKTVAATRREIERLTLRDGDLLLTEGGDMDKLGRGTCWRSQLPVCIHQNHIFRIRFSADRYDPDFVSLQVSSPYGKAYFLAHAKKTTGIASINQQVLGAFPLLSPSLDEQQKVANVLINNIKSAEEARLAAQVQYLDAGQLILVILEQSFSSLYHVPRARIGEIARTTSGSTPSRSRKDYWCPGIHPWVKTSEVAFRPIVQTEESISDLALQECSLSLLPAGTVLVAMYGQGKTRGQSAVLQISATTNQACFAILPNESLDPYYLQLWLRHSYGTLRALSESRGGNQSNLNAEMLNAFEIPLLPLEEQRALASRLSAAIAEAESMQRLLAAKLSDIELLPSRILAQAFDS